MLTANDMTLSDTKPAAILKVSPLTLLAVCLIVAMVLLALPIRLPVGGNYWDIIVYFDAAHRLNNGQTPHTDFFTPVGGLGYYLFVAVKKLWPQANPILAVQWSTLIIAAPLMALIVAQVDRLSRPQALGLILPFILFGFLPINGIEAYPSSTFDAFGNYNRQSVLLLYVLVSALMFVQTRVLRNVVIAILLSALLFIKVTGFVVGFALVAYALVCGRINWRDFLFALFGFLAINYAIELINGMYSEYLADILQLVTMNRGTFLPRLAGVMTLKFDMIACIAALLAITAWEALPRHAAAVTSGSFPTLFGAARKLLNSSAAWLAVTAAGAIIFETQNTGSQEFIFIWPVLLGILCKWKSSVDRRRPVVLLLIAAITLPVALHTLYRATRATAAAIAYQPLPSEYLDRLGRASAGKALIARAQILNDHYARFQDSYRSLAKQDQLPSLALHAEPDYQVAWLLNVDAAAKALVDYETRNNVHFDSVFALDFVDPFSYLLNRKPIRNVSIGIDPTRTFPALTPETVTEIANMGAILIPKCPITSFRDQIRDGFEPALRNRRTVELTPCWDLSLRN